LGQVGPSLFPSFFINKNINPVFLFASSSSEESSEESDGKVERSRKYKLTIERRLDKKHFDAVF